MSIVLGLVAGWGIGLLLFMAYDSYVKSRVSQRCRQIQADYEEKAQKQREEWELERPGVEKFIMDSIIRRNKWPLTTLSP